MNNYLKRIRIQRFRSITDQTIDLAPITVFVGANDSGKSNILKAINLLFNGEVVSGSGYNHRRDFSKIAPKRPRKADEVTITATIKSPLHEGEIYWRKDWRSSGLYKEHDFDYKPDLKPFSKVPVWLKRLNYRYVPANKGDAYMKNLMHELHGLLATTVDKKIRANAKNFIDDIQKHTAQISEGIKDALDLDSYIQLPTDLSSLFELFDFETDGKISLGQRGDGIRARHIPVILGYLADRKNHAKGTVRGNTIWGYEEPENNIEMGAAFKQAERFASYAECNHIQILMTTHSPAFYGLGERKRVKVYHVRNEGGQAGGDTIVEPIDNFNDADNVVGLMPFIASRTRDLVRAHEEQMAETAYIIKDLNRRYGKSLPTDKPILFVEGEFDKQIIDVCVQRMCPDKKDKFNIFAVQGAAKMPAVMSAMKGLTMSRHPVKFVGLFDNDAEGQKAQRRCRKLRIAADKPRVKYKTITVSTPSSFRGYNVQSSFCLEHALPVSYWEEAWECGFLEEFDDTYISIKSIPLCPHPNDIRLLHKIKHDSKTAFAGLVVRKIAKEGVPDDLQEQVQKLIEELEI